MQSCSVNRLSWVRIRRILLQHSLVPFRRQSCSRPCCLCNHKLVNNRRHKLLARKFNRVRLEMLPVRKQLMRLNLHRRQMSTHALQKMTRDLFRAMSLPPRQKCPRNVVEMKEAMADFFGSDSVAISCHCKRSKIILVEVLTEVCSLENIASWNWRKIAVAWSDSVLLTFRLPVYMWKTCRKSG